MLRRWLQLYRHFPKMTRFILTNSFLLFIISSYGQNTGQSRGKVLTIDTITKTTFRNGDTLSITVRNLTPQRRGFTVEALSMEKQSYYYSAVYSAYFNNDTLFFKTLKATQELSRETHTQYALPNYQTHPYSIKANSDTTIKFILKGVPIQKGTMLRLRITSDIVNDDQETIYSNPIKVLLLPN